MSRGHLDDVTFPELQIDFEKNLSLFPYPERGDFDAHAASFSTTIVIID
jgi:hypothetical protein